MQHITGKARDQMVFTSLEDSVSEDNPVRFIDAFVENIDLKALGFEVKTQKTEGRPNYSTKIFLKIYLYGYLNGLRSSRKLEKECVRNMELQWLLCALVPNYHSISDFRKDIAKCKEENIRTIVAHPTLVNSNENGTTMEYLVANFIYNAEADTYQCPQGEILRTTGRRHKKTRERDSYEFKKYRTPSCIECPAKSLCTGRKDGREIERSQYAGAVEENNQRYRENGQLYRKRQEINEHIFGTIKRQWGYNHTNLTGLEKVNGEHSLIMLVYNIKRTINILGVTELIAKLKNWKSPYKAKAYFVSQRRILCSLQPYPKNTIGCGLINSSS